MEANDLNELFEDWFSKEFWESPPQRATTFSNKNGYEDDDTNIMWVGFCAGFDLRGQND